LPPVSLRCSLRNVLLIRNHVRQGDSRDRAPQGRQIVAPPGLYLYVAVVAGAHAPAYSLPPLRGFLRPTMKSGSAQIFRMS
jgi:hypothetical protein